MSIILADILCGPLKLWIFECGPCTEKFAHPCRRVLYWYPWGVKGDPQVGDESEVSVVHDVQDVRAADPATKECLSTGGGCISRRDHLRPSGGAFNLGDKPPCPFWWRKGAGDVYVEVVKATVRLREGVVGNFACLTCQACLSQLRMSLLTPC